MKWAPIALAAAVVWAIVGLDFQSLRPEAISNSARWFIDNAFPLDWSILPELRSGFIETIQIALLSTLIGFALALPIGIMSSRNLFPRFAPVTRFVATSIRVMPSILWAIFAVLLLGFGPLAGVVAMAFYTAGYLAKLQYEAFEGLPRDPFDAVRAMGANRFQQTMHVLLPEAGNSLRSQLLFMFEYNIRSSTVIGIVGAGGIGQLLGTYLKFFQYDRVMTLLLVLFVIVLALDGLSIWLRRRYTELPDRPRLRDIMVGK
jgi:phosphonate transport system permease protein